MTHTATHTPRLIALCSPAMGSGKSTIATHLCDQHGFRQIAFATPLKCMASALLESVGLDHDEIEARIYGDRKEEVIPVLAITSRQLQQQLGTEFGRKMIRELLWVDITMAAVARAMSAGHSVVIDDMRFPNEYDAVIAAGGDAYRVVRPSAVVTRVHPSEGALDLVAMPEIWNKGTVVQMLASVDDLLL